ncbi:lycopene cyclase domain-containing protein [Hufsiella ginkgonis]|uniref:Lycopene cyclase domain-containing protein n=1 Tax=Hufsiella ginkgonis TaxID=2695274 RepID=A0A7K1XYG9_9SPHI|nr:lycopene cyclase domain-containing protein [Hufsiella ginkgonis]MXV16041.1 lycopene cyclase domain-containing protein [Hufsiella ginkgonis]
MDKQYTYLLINFLTVLFPVALSFDKRVAFYKNWKFIFPGLFLSGCLFLVWDYVFTLTGVWTFNPEYIVGIYLYRLPLEEILFFFTVPFSCIFIYACLNHYFNKPMPLGPGRYVSFALMGVSLVLVLVFRGSVYTVVTFSLLLALLFYACFILRVTFLNRFYRAYLVSLLPFYIVNGLLTSIPVVLYNDAENMGARVGSIPLEDHFYLMALLLTNLLFFHYFKKK